jgi:hypothetical protein
VSSELSILRAHFREHNRSVIFASVATLLFAALGWAVVYGLCYWFTVAFLSVKEGLKFIGTENFNRNFLSSVAVLYAATVIDRWLFRFDREAVDRRPFSETILDVALFLPRMTLAVLENFGVWIHLSAREVALSARLVELIRERGRYSLQEVPLVSPAARDRDRILFALRVALVVDVRAEDGVMWLHIGSLAPASLAPVLGSGYGYHNIPRVRRRAVLENENALPRSQHQLPGGDGDDL